MVGIKKLLAKIKEALIAVLPITIIILIMNFIAAKPLNGLEIASFLFGAFLLIIGMSLYSLGSETALEPIGEAIGSKTANTKSVPLILIIGFIIGFIVTIAEPDLLVLGQQLGSIKWTLIIVIAFGVGLFLVVALTKIILQIPLNFLLFVLYALLFILSAFVDPKYLALSFDSGGVTTGPITVPFIMALGIGVASVIGSKKKADSFGIVALCSVGPIIAVLLLSLIFKPSIDTTIAPSVEISTVGQMFSVYLYAFPEYLKEVAIALAPITVFFIVYNFIKIKLPKIRFIRMLIGILYTYIGLSIFLTGVNVGFMSTGHYIGQQIASRSFKYILIPIGMIVGFFIVMAEPAVHVLTKQVEEISAGAIKRNTMLITLCIAMMIAVGLSMVRVLTGISLWYFILPGYCIALLLSIFVPKIYTAVAFDSGGVASGPMTATFLLPFAIGACLNTTGNVLTDAYGVVAMVAMTPLIAIQIMGLIASIKQKNFNGPRKKSLDLLEKDIIDLNI